MKRTESKRQIVEVAQKLFSQKGYYGTTIRDIAKARGILPGSLYSLIDSKEDLLFQIANTDTEVFLQALEPIVAIPCSASEKIQLGVSAHLRIVAEHLDAASVFFHEWNALSEERRKMVLDKRDRYESLWAKILQDGVERGEFHVNDLKFARMMILTVINSVYQWYDPKGSNEPKEIAHHFVKLILQGLVGERET